MARTAINCKAIGGVVIYEGERFWCSTMAEAKKMLEEEGVAVLLNALTPAQIGEMQEGMWDTLEWLTSTQPVPLVRDKPETYGAVRGLMPNHGSLFQGWPGLAHRPHMWMAREATAPMFAEIWDCDPDDLLCSMDATSMGVVHLVPERPTGFERGNVWLHSDQAPTRSDFECVQGWVTGENVEAGDATLRVLPGSHKLLGQFAAENGVTETADWYKLNEEERAWYTAQGCEDVRLMVPAGALVLWDSRTIHSGAAPLREAPNPKPRNVVYVCMQPRHPTIRGMGLGRENRRLTKAELTAMRKTLEKRREILTPGGKYYGRMTTHWPRKTMLFGKFPRAYGPKPPEWEALPMSPIPELTQLQRKLAGLDA